MCAEVDFLLALIKDDDWLGESAERVYRNHEDAFWTSHYALLELLLVAYREDLNVERVVADASELLEVRGEADLVLAAASYVSERGMTPFDAIHALATGESPIVSSDSAYDDVAERVAAGGHRRIAARAPIGRLSQRLGRGTRPARPALRRRRGGVLAAPDAPGRLTTVSSVSREVPWPWMGPGLR